MQYRISSEITNNMCVRYYLKNNKCSLVWKSPRDIILNGTPYRKTNGILIDPDRKVTQIDIGVSSGTAISLRLDPETELIIIRKEDTCIGIKTM